MNNIHINKRQSLLHFRFFKLAAISAFLFIPLESLHAKPADPPDTTIDWQKEEQLCARYQAACRYAGQVLYYENWSPEKKTKWGTQLIWYTLKGIRMSAIRLTACFYNEISDLDKNLSNLDESQKADAENKIASEIKGFNRVVDEVSKLKDRLISLMKLYEATLNSSDQKVKETLLLNNANYMLMSGEYETSHVTDASFDNISYLHEAHRALYHCFENNREAAAIHYQKAIQEGMQELRNRAKVVQKDYDVIQDMRRAVELLEEANSLLERESEPNIEKLNGIFEELLNLHERISYTPTYHLNPAFFHAWFAHYSGELNKLRLYSEKHSLGDSTPLILDKDNLLFLYFIAI